MATKSKGKAGGAKAKSASGGAAAKRPSAFMKGKGPKTRKPKDQRQRVNVQLIKADTAEGKPIFSLIARIIEKHHPDLVQARVAAAWNLSWKPDADGVKTIGKLRKASDLDRELSGGEWDFVILLSKDWWERPLTSELTEKERELDRAALIDHELEHITEALMQNGEPKIDERGRKRYRLRKHDITEFAAILYRHGPRLKSGLVDAFNSYLKRRGQLPLTPPKPKPETDADRGKAALSTLKGNLAEPLVDVKEAPPTSTGH
jgi:hypothetical protein